MNPLATKALVGVGGLTLVGGGGILAWQQGVFSSSPKNIRERLLSEGYKILNSNSDEWTKIFNVYKEAGNTKWKFENDGVTAASQDTEIQKLKNKCNDILKNDSSDEKNYSSATKWCVVPRKAEEFVSGLLSTIEGQDGDSWGRVLARYKTTKTPLTGSSSKYALNDVSIAEPDNGNNVANIKALQTGCITRKAKLTYELNFDSAVKEMGEWCLDKKVG